MLDMLMISPSEEELLRRQFMIRRQLARLTSWRQVSAPFSWQQVS
jgi:hypothetical protein